METTLYKRKRGKPLKHDFSGLKLGEFKRFSGRARKNPYPYAAYWNSTRDIKIEVWYDGDNIPCAKRIL